MIPVQVSTLSDSHSYLTSPSCISIQTSQTVCAKAISILPNLPKSALQKRPTIIQATATYQIPAMMSKRRATIGKPSNPQQKNDRTINPRRVDKQQTWTPESRATNRDDGVLQDAMRYNLVTTQSELIQASKGPTPYYAMYKHKLRYNEFRKVILGIHDRFLAIYSQNQTSYSKQLNIESLD
jgi:hypothetical protein